MPGAFGLRITPISDRIIGANNTVDVKNMLKNGETLKLVDFHGNIKDILEWDVLSLIP